MEDPRSILVIQTAFVGDVILTIPLLQVLKRQYPSAPVDVVVIPAAAILLKNHPAVTRVLIYDKRGSDRGLRGFLRRLGELRSGHYDLAIVPHRSIRSAALAACAGIPRRIGFSTSAGRFLFTSTVRPDRTAHEVDRNLSLLEGLAQDIETSQRREFPRLYPSEDDSRDVDRFLAGLGIAKGGGLVAVAPGTVWNTKRWPKERFAGLCSALAAEHRTVILIGGADDAALCREIARTSAPECVFSAAGDLTLLQSAELIRRCAVLVSNDSAPMHLALAVGTPVVAIYGATIPGFGFAPYGPHDSVVETKGLSCRPCSIHGGDRCPIGTFECMQRIAPADVLARVHEAVTLRR